MKRRHALGLSVLAACSPAGQATISRGPSSAPPGHGADVAVPESGTQPLPGDGLGPATTSPEESAGSATTADSSGSTVTATTSPPDQPSIEVQSFALPEQTDDALSDDEWWESQPGFSGARPLPPESVRQCESGGNYSAVNGRSGAGGAWQVMPGTWDGYQGYERAEDAPPAVQDAKAAELWADGAGASHWEACL